MTLYLLLITYYIIGVSKIECEATSFVNEVKYPAENENNRYAFDFGVTEGMSMSVWNPIRNTYQPTVKINGSFFLRNRLSASSCSSLIPLHKSVSDRIVKAAGRHRNMLLINKQFPGTPVVVPINSQVEITVRNRLMSEAISMHWHGQTQRGSFYMDGVSRVTQCSIGPGETYVYKFRATDVGTHFYHAHVGVQRNEGLYGPFIVLDVPHLSRPKYEKEFYFIVHDWYQENSNSLFNRVIWEEIRFMNGDFENLEKCYNSNRIDDGTPGTMLPFNRKTDAILINGKGSYKIMDQINKLKDVDRILNSRAFDLDLEEFEVKPNKKYLFRVIGANAGHALEIRVGHHKLHVVATDGNPIKPIEADSLIINGGERYDFYIDTKGQDNQFSYFITVKTLETRDNDFNMLTFDNFGLAILKYSNTNRIFCGNACMPCTKQKGCTKVNCPFWPNEYDGSYKCITVDQMRSESIPESDSDLLLKSYSSSANFEEHFFNFHFAGSSTLRSSINGIRFIMPSIPLFFRRDLKSVLTPCAPKCFDENQSCECSHSLKIGTNKVIQFVMYNMGNGAGTEGNAHPIHLHGHNFYVVHIGFPLYYTNNHTYHQLNQDLNCFDDTQICDKGAWRNASWQFGNLPRSNLIDPPLKDTLSIPVGGNTTCLSFCYAVVRFKSNNIGYWMMHCHIDIHHGEGMAMIIQEGTESEIARMVNFSDVNFCENKIESIGLQDFPNVNQHSKSKLERLYQFFVDPVYKYIFKFFW